MADEVKKLGLEIDTAKAKKQIADLGKDAEQALNPPSKGVDQLNQKLTVAQGNFRSLLSSQQSFLAKGQEGAAAAAKVTQEMEAQVKQIRKLTTDQEDRNILLQKEVELRKQAKDLAASTKTPSSTTLPGAGGSGGSGQLTFPGVSSGLSGAAFGAVIGAFAFAAKSFADTLNEAGQKAKEFSQHVSDAGGSMDKLRQSLQNNNYESSKLAHNPTVIDFEKMKTDWDTAWKKAVGDTIEAFKNGADDLKAGMTGGPGGAEKARNARAAEIEKKLATPDQLVGPDKITYDQLKRQGVELEQDLTRQKEALDHDFMKQHRDLQLEEKEERINFDNQVFDNKLQKEREVRNFQHDMAKLNADVEFKASQEKYDLERAAEKRNFDQKQQDEKTLAQFAKQDREQQAAFATQDRGNKLNLTLGRNLEDYETELNRANLTGGMSSADYIFKAQDFRKQQNRLVQDTSIEQAQADRNLGYQNFTANRDLQFKQSTEKRDFGQDQALKAKEREIDLATHQYQLDQERYQLTTQFNDAMQDNAESLRRLTVQQKLTEEKFKNREDDLAYNEKTANRDFQINADRSRRSVQESKQEFAAGLYGRDPYGFDKVAQGNPELGQDLAGYLQRAGLPGYVNRVKTELDSFRKNHGTPAPTNAGDVSDQQGGYSQPGGGNGNTPIFQDTNVYDNQGNWDGTTAALGLPRVEKDKLVFVHKDEAILPKDEATMYRSFKGGDNSLKKVSGWQLPSLAQLASQNAGAAQNRASFAAGSIQSLADANAGAAQGSPMPFTPPINMPGGAAGQPIQISIGNDQFHFNGVNADQLQSTLGQMRQEYLSNIQKFIQQAQGGSFNTMKRVQGYQS